MVLYFITGNPNKFGEAKALLPKIRQLDIDLPEIQELDPKEIMKEKLLEALKHKKAEFIIDDVSLHLDCMNGLPGPLIKWFIKTIGIDGLYDIAKKYNNYECSAVAMIGYAKKPEEIYFFEGTVSGKIVKPKSKGFGWDPIFLPKGSKKTYGEMTKAQKRKVSMRTIALTKFKEFRYS